MLDQRDIEHLHRFDGVASLPRLIDRRKQHRRCVPKELNDVSLKQHRFRGQHVDLGALGLDAQIGLNVADTQLHCALQGPQVEIVSRLGHGHQQAPEPGLGDRVVLDQPFESRGLPACTARGSQRRSQARGNHGKRKQQGDLRESGRTAILPSMKQSIVMFVIAMNPSLSTTTFTVMK
jgi:hypothetical protein